MVVEKKCVKCGKPSNFRLCRECFLVEQKTKSADLNKAQNAVQLSPVAQRGGSTSSAVASFEDEAELLGKCVDEGVKQAKQLIKLLKSKLLLEAKV